MKQDASRIVFLNSSLGKTLGEPAIDELCRISDRRTFSKGSLIFQEDDDPAGIFFVIDGIVKLVHYSEDGREVILHLAEPVRTIAEGAVFLGYYPATAVAVEDTTLLLLRKDEMFEMMDRHPAFLRYIFNTMAHWLKRLVKKINQLTIDDATARVIYYLESLIRDGAGKEDGNSAVVELPVPKGELARLLNMKQGSLSRVFRRLQDQELISVSARTITISNRKALSKLTLPPLE